MNGLHELPSAQELAERPADALAPVIARWSHALALRVGSMTAAEMLRDLADDLEKAFFDANGGANGG